MTKKTDWKTLAEKELRAEKKCTISKINAAAGDSLAVDEVIMEFE